MYQEHLLEGAWYSAAVALAEIFHASARLPAEQRAAWRSRVNKDLTGQFLREVRNGQEEKIHRIRRILSVGSEWTGEEILLLMLMRIDVKLLSDFLGSGVEVESQVHLKDIDLQLSTLAKSKNHAHHFRWALQRMKNNAPYDVESVWLSLIDRDQT
ncbi:MAG TPA: hypothetical protein VJM12_05665 [Pyrinomonadaceae bacterium]|nr:hypothetical protein [Pyrinomonadaceae bacterium]